MYTKREMGLREKTRMWKMSKTKIDLIPNHDDGISEFESSSWQSPYQEPSESCWDQYHQRNRFVFQSGFELYQQVGWRDPN